MKAIKILSISFYLLPSLLFGQTGEYQKVMESFRQKLNGKRYSTELQLKFFSTQQSPIPLQTKSMEIQVFDKYLHYLAGSIEVFTSPKWIINIDHAQKTILINSVFKRGTQILKKSELTIYDSLLLNYFDAKLIEKKENISKFRIIPKGSNQKIKSAFFTINMENLTPVSIDLNYAVSFQDLFQLYSFGNEQYGVDVSSKPRLLIEYKKFKYVVQFNKNYFDFEPFVVYSRKSWSLGKKAQNYKLIDYSNSKS